MRDRGKASGLAGDLADGGQVPPVERLPSWGSDDLAQVIGDEVDPFNSPQPAVTWLPKSEHFGIRIAGRLAAHAGIVTVPVVVENQDFPVIGFGGVIVAREYRGQGLGRLLMTAATERARELGPEVGLLFCWLSRTGFYGRLGWQLFPAETSVVVEQPDGPADMPMRSMWLPLREDATWPAGSVCLRSLPM